jgi:hypothetical protein
MHRAILIKSCQRFQSRRAACDATWAGKIAETIPVYFVEGNHPRNELFGNVIQLNEEDGYSDNSFKLRGALRFLLDHSNFSTVFIADDNTFVHPRRWLHHFPGGELEGLKTDKIPHIHGGGGWWMSRHCCELYVAGVRRRCSWDDQLATEILERGLRIPMINRPDLYAQWDERVSADNALITCHNVDPLEMGKLFTATADLT